MLHPLFRTLFFVFVLVGGLTAEEVVPVSIPSPARFFHLDFTSESARVGSSWRMGASLRTANLWNHHSVFANSKGETFSYSGDGELTDGEIHTAIPVLSWLELQGELHGMFLYGGWMDQGIEDWHAFFRIRTHDRENYERNQQGISFGSLKWDSPQLFVSKAALKVKANFINLPFLAMAVRADISVPVGKGQNHPLAGPDAGLGLLASFEPLRFLHLQSSLGLVLMSRDAGLPESLVLNSPQVFFDLGIWIIPHESFAVFFGHKYTGAMFRQDDWSYVPRNGVLANENERISSGEAALFGEGKWIYLGVQLNFKKQFSLSLTLLEDLWIKDWSTLKFEGNDSPDLLVGLRFTWKNS